VDPRTRSTSSPTLDRADHQWIQKSMSSAPKPRKPRSRRPFAHGFLKPFTSNPPRDPRALERQLTFRNVSTTGANSCLSSRPAGRAAKVLRARAWSAVRTEAAGNAGHEWRPSPQVVGTDSRLIYDGFFHCTSSSADFGRRPLRSRMSPGGLRYRHPWVAGLGRRCRRGRDGEGLWARELLGGRARDSPFQGSHPGNQWSRGESRRRPGSKSTTPDPRRPPTIVPFCKST